MKHKHTTQTAGNNMNQSQATPHTPYTQWLELYSEVALTLEEIEILKASLVGLTYPRNKSELNRFVALHNKEEQHHTLLVQCNTLLGSIKAGLSERHVLNWMQPV